MDEINQQNEERDYKNRWLFDVNRKPVVQASELSFGRVKTYLYENLLRCITKHDLNGCFGILELLARETTVDPYIFFRFVMILLESNRTESVNKNVIIYLETLISKLDVRKPDIFIEFLAYFIRHGRIEDAREIFSQRYRFMTFRCHRSLPEVDINLRCYEFLLNYLGWVERTNDEDINHSFDVSIQGWIVNAIDCLKSTTSNHEYFVMCVVRILLYYGYYKKAYLFVSEFQRKNPDNIGAQLLHYHLLDKLDILRPRKSRKKSNDEQDLTDEARDQKRHTALDGINNFTQNMKDEIFEPKLYPIEEDRNSIARNLRRLDVGNEVLMRLGHLNDNLIGTFKDLMDGMEVVSEIGNLSRWSNLREILYSILHSNNETLTADARTLWTVRYKQLWNSIDFLPLAGQISGADKCLIEEVLNILNKTLDSPLGS